MAGSERFLMQSIKGGSTCKTQVFVFVNSPRTVLLQKKKHTEKPKKKKKTAIKQTKPDFLSSQKALFGLTSIPAVHVSI